MTREKLVEVMARAECVEGGYDPDERMPNDGPRWGYYVPGVTAALSALEAAGVRLVYPGEARAQLIDGDERTTVKIFTPYAPPRFDDLKSQLIATRERVFP